MKRTALILALTLTIILSSCQIATNRRPASPADPAAPASKASTAVPAKGAADAPLAAASDAAAPAAPADPAAPAAPAAPDNDAAPAAPSLPATADLIGLDIDTFFEHSYALIGLRSPQAITELGLSDALGMGNDQLDDLSDAYARETYDITVAIRDLLLTYDRDTLSAEQALSYDVYLWFLEDQIEGYTYANNDYLIRPGIIGYQDSLIHFFTQIHPVTDKQDAADYITRLTQVETQMLQVVDGLNRREQAGVMLPRFINQWVTRQIQAVAYASPKNTDFYTAFAQKLNALNELSKDDKQTLLDEAKAAIETSVQPGFIALADCLTAQQSKTDDRIGASKFPNGAEYYDYILRHYTTTDLTADEIHTLGLQELDRIQAEMRVLFDELGYPQNASLPDLFNRVAKDGGSVFGSDIVAEYETIIANADAAVADAFDMRPQADVIVIGGDSGGYYVSPAVDGSRPGAFYARATGSETRFTMRSLAYHEAIPGHHYQLALAQELDLPFFRANMHFTGYIEGWALYAEYLAKDLGWYDDDIYGDLGRLQYEAFRAMRLVVDTGIHSQNWTYDQALDYMVETTGMPKGMMESELWRYITWPGQATAYKVGMLKIIELRERAQTALGDAFDFKAFHNVLIGNGSVPLAVLESLVDEYITTSQMLASSTSVDTPSTDARELSDVERALLPLQNLPIDDFFEAAYRLFKQRSPQSVTYDNLAAAYGMRNDQLDDLSDAFLHETQALQIAVLDLLHTYDRAYANGDLTPDQVLSYDVYEWHLDNQIRGHQYMYHGYVLHDFLNSYHDELIRLLTEIHPMTNLQDAEDYVTRLGLVNTQVTQLMEGLQIREDMGIIPPSFILISAINQMRNYLGVSVADPAQVNATNLSVYTVFEEKLNALDDLSTDQKQALLADAEQAITESFIPAYITLLTHMNHLRDLATADAGVWKLPDGDNYYLYLLRDQTSTDMTPEEIHTLGLTEIDRIMGEMQKVFAELGYPADATWVDVRQRAMDEAGYQDIRTEQAKLDLLDTYVTLLDAMEERVSPVFDMRPSTKVQVVGGDSGGYYVSGSPDGSRPGAYHVNTSVSWSPHLFRDTIAYHEAVPGHHFQIAIAQELDLPTFRTDMFFNGYAEGWALYAEQLAWELGAYDDDPYGNLGRLDLELRRAVRLVVDTGIHAMQWSRSEAKAYMRDVYGADYEVERYIVMPAQATGYKIGMLKILELRQKAQTALGDAFDLKDFHNVVIGNGAVPLDILERLVDNYIAENK